MTALATLPASSVSILPTPALVMVIRLWPATIWTESISTIRNGQRDTGASKSTSRRPCRCCVI